MKKLLIILVLISAFTYGCKAQSLTWWNNLGIDSTTWEADYSSMAIWKDGYNYVISLTSPPIAESGDSWYFSESSGNDANDGHSSTYPKQTISELNDILADSVEAGDVVYLKCGDRWDEEEINITTSGSYGNPITLSAYGTGAKPIISMRHSITGWDTPGNWTQSGSYWYMTMADQRRLWLNGTEVKEAEDNDPANLSSSYPFCFDAGNLYIYSATNPASTYSSILGIEMTDNALNANNMSYIVIDSIDFRGANYTVRINGGHNISFTDCTIGIGGHIGLRLYAQSVTYTEIDTISIIDCTFDAGNTLWYTTHNDPNNEDALHINGPIDSLIVSGCLFKNWAHDGINLYPGLPDTADLAKDIYIMDNEFTNPDITYGRALDIQTVVSGSENINIMRNYIHDTPTGSQLLSSYTKFYNNIIDSVAGDVYGMMSQYGTEGNGLGTSHYRGSNITDLWVANNLIIKAANWGYDIRTRNGENGKIYGSYVWNNIFAYNCYTTYGVLGFQYNTGAHTQIRHDDGNSLFYEMSYRNNNFYDTSAISGTELVAYSPGGGDEEFTVTEFNAMHLSYNDDTIQNNVGTDPGLDDPANGDYNITTGSDADGGGTDIGWYLDDYEEVTVGSPPNIGPLETTVAAMRMIPENKKREYLALIKKINERNNSTAPDLGAHETDY